MALYINGNKTGGGGGNADIVHLTQSEYDALPDSKLTDDKVYMITDTNGDGSQFQPIIYSENEREIGVWTDGKPLYEKTFYLASGSLATGSLDIPNDLTNIDRVIGYSGVVHSDSEDRDFKLPYTRVQYNESIFILNMVLIDDTVATSIISGDHSSYNQLSNIYVTLQYTKTTDTAGSGTWTPQGVPAVHYSTDEQVVGTWIDGSTLYEKTVIVSNMMIGYDGTIHTSIPHNISNFGYATSLNILCPKIGISAGESLNDFKGLIAEFRVDDTNIYAHSGTDHYGESEDRVWYFIVRYTKSSQGGN